MSGQWVCQRVPGTGRSSGGWGRLRPGLSESIACLPSSAAHKGAFTRDTGREESAPTAAFAGGNTSLVRALALHGVALPVLKTGSRRSHLASPLKPGRGVLIRSVSRRLGSVACVREDASPNEVSCLTNYRMHVPIPAVKPTRRGIRCRGPEAVAHPECRRAGGRAATAWSPGCRSRSPRRRAWPPRRPRAPASRPAGRWA